jgi:hypothetical protein
MSWAAEEFKDIDLGDKRLDKRAVLLAERLAEKPTASIPGACGGWAETQAAYRFLAQEERDWRDILAPLLQRAPRRACASMRWCCASKTPPISTLRLRSGQASTARPSAAWGH